MIFRWCYVGVVPLSSYMLLRVHLCYSLLVLYDVRWALCNAMWRFVGCYVDSILTLYDILLMLRQLYVIVMSL